MADFRAVEGTLLLFLLMGLPLDGQVLIGDWSYFDQTGCRNRNHSEAFLSLPELCIDDPGNTFPCRKIPVMAGT
jgi:hypothetical protein